MVRKHECAYLCGGDCRLCKEACKCRDENDVCVDAVRKVSHSKCVNVLKPVKHYDLQTPKGRFRRHTEHVHGFEVYKSCISKKRWVSEHDANKWAKNFAARFGKQQHAYYCRFCEGYHLTTRNPDDRVRYDHVA